jgi:glucokinase
MKAFTAKGRFHSLLCNVPVRVITNDMTALFGAGRVAALGITSSQH